MTEHTDKNVLMKCVKCGYIFEADESKTETFSDGPIAGNCFDMLETILGEQVGVSISFPLCWQGNQIVGEFQRLVGIL